MLALMISSRCCGRRPSRRYCLGEFVADGCGVGVAGAQDTGAVGDHLAVEFLGFGAAALAAGETGQSGARGEGVGVVVTEEPAAIGQDLAAQLLGFGVAAPQLGQPGQGAAGGQGVGMVLAVP